jgi:hypothetical protein
VRAHNSYMRNIYFPSAISGNPVVLSPFVTSHSLTTTPLLRILPQFLSLHAAPAGAPP